MKYGDESGNEISPMQEADARLIAAAPDLLEACQGALAKLTGNGWDGTLGHHPDNPIPAKLRAAITKATGKEPA
jgi:hypothetical protein